jgi:AraC-like DNA-binding protein
MAADQHDIDLDWDESQDVLSALVRIVGLRGLVLSTMALGAPWRVRNAVPADPVLHVVTAGLAFFRSHADETPVQLTPGDAVMLPGGGAYELVDEYPSRAEELIDVPQQADGMRCSLRLGGSGARTELTCCKYRFRDATAAPLLNLLPPRIVVRSGTGSSGVRSFLRELVAESKANRPGTEGVMSRLAELVFLLVLRSHFDAHGSVDRGLLAAVADPRVGRALKQIHGSLGTAWTVAKLAGSVGMSRAAFSQLFTAKTGVSPMAYTQRCRLQEAARLLRETNLNLSEIGQCVGYSDATAFSRAFRRDVGSSPTDYRRGLGP